MAILLSNKTQEQDIQSIWFRTQSSTQYAKARDLLKTKTNQSNKCKIVI